MNKIVRNSIALLVLIALLGGGIWWVLKAEPKEEAGGQQEEAPQQTVYEIEEEQISAVEIENNGSTLRFFKEKEQWVLEGTEPEQVSQFKVRQLISSVVTVKSQGTVTDSMEACGLDAPKLQVTVTRADGGRDIIKIGGKSPVLQTYFFAINDSSTIYTMLAARVDDFLKPLTYYTEFSRLDFSGMEIRDVTIERTGGTTVRLSRKPGAYDGITTAWEITAPYSRTYDGNDQYIQEHILDKIKGLDISTPAEEAQTGLHTPKAVLSVTAVPENGTQGDSVTAVLKVGNTSGDITYVSYEDKVYQVPAQSIAFINVEESLLVFKLIALVPVQRLHTMTVTGGTQTDVFEIGHTNFGAEEDQISFQINGTAADDKKAKEAYQQVIGMEAAAPYQGEPLGDKLAEVVFELPEGKKTVTFFDVNELYASFTVDGVTEFMAKKTKVSDMLYKIREFAQNPV